MTAKNMQVFEAKLKGVNHYEETREAVLDHERRLAALEAPPVKEEKTVKAHKKGSILQALKEIREAGGDAWDAIDDPDAYIRWMRGDDILCPSCKAPMLEKDGNFHCDKCGKPSAPSPEPAKEEPKPVDGSARPIEFCWLIERRITSVADYWAGNGWHPDCFYGIRFCRREDACTVICALNLYKGTAEEHAFAGGRIATVPHKPISAAVSATPPTPKPAEVARECRKVPAPQHGEGKAKACALDFESLRAANVERCESAFHMCDDWSPTDWACAMAGECGEACNYVKKLRRLGEQFVRDVPASGEAIVESIGKEIADMIIYADLLAHRLGLSLNDCVRDKFNEVSDRVKSPIKLQNPAPAKEAPVESIPTRTLETITTEMMGLISVAQRNGMTSSDSIVAGAEPFLQRLLDLEKERDAAKAPVEAPAATNAGEILPCRHCGSEPEGEIMPGNKWGCPKHSCMQEGPRDDADGRKWNEQNSLVGDEAAANEELRKAHLFNVQLMQEKIDLMDERDRATAELVEAKRERDEAKNKYAHAVQEIINEQRGSLELRREFNTLKAQLAEREGQLAETQGSNARIKEACQRAERDRNEWYRKWELNENAKVNLSAELAALRTQPVGGDVEAYYFDPVTPLYANELYLLQIVGNDWKLRKIGRGGINYEYVSGDLAILRRHFPANQYTFKKDTTYVVRDNKVWPYKRWGCARKDEWEINTDGVLHKYDYARQGPGVALFSDPIPLPAMAGITTQMVKDAVKAFFVGGSNEGYIDPLSKFFIKALNIPEATT